jgi:multidrug resistance efflux pump
MLELIFCSMLTILPDFLIRRYAQGKRIGQEITLFSVWYELRWGITACVILTIGLVTVVFYYHPATSNVTAFYRTVPVLPETGGRVTEIYVKLNQEVDAGQPLFKLDSTLQQTALTTAQQRVLEIDAQMKVAQADLITADGKISEAQGSYQQALDELATKTELRSRNKDVVSLREIEKLQNIVDARKGSLEAVKSNKISLETSANELLPAQRASAEAQVAEAQAQLSKMTIYAGIDGVVEQFTLRPGDYINPMLRPAGLIVPRIEAVKTFEAGFGQISAQVIHVGMTAEMTCASKPFTVIPMVVVDIQGVISSGQLRQTDVLVDPAQVQQPGSITVYLQPMFEGGVDGIPPGSTCSANAYTSNYDRLHSGEELGTFQALGMHAVDTVGLVHALLLRIQALTLPIFSLVLSGGH